MRKFTKEVGSSLVEAALLIALIGAVSIGALNHVSDGAEHAYMCTALPLSGATPLIQPTPVPGRGTRPTNGQRPGGGKTVTTCPTGTYQYIRAAN